MGRSKQLATPDYPSPTSAAASAVMRANRGTDTTAERAIRSLLHARGFRFRKHLPIQAGMIRVRPDLVFTRQRLAVFVDGCFWHGCPDHGNVPRTNIAYWKWKLDRNRARDSAVDEALAAAGWVVLRIWEHVPAVEGATAIEAKLRRSRGERVASQT